MKKKTKIKKEIVSHLKEDIKGYKKQRSHLKEEMGEDKKLIKKLKTPTKRAKNGKKKR